MHCAHINYLTVAPVDGGSAGVNNFVEGLKNQISTFCISADGFKIFLASLLFRKIIF